MNLEIYELLFRDKESGRYFLLHDSDNYGYDCYSFDEEQEPEDGYIPFAIDICDERHGLSYNEVQRELRLIDDWNERMTTEEKVDYCLQGMGSSLSKCEQIINNELAEELWDKC